MPRQLRKIKSDMSSDNSLMLRKIKWVTSGKQLTNYNDNYAHSLTMKKLLVQRGCDLLKQGPSSIQMR